MNNEYSKAIKVLKNDCMLGIWSDDSIQAIKILEKIVGKETPMKVDKKDTMECECDDDWEYFPYTTAHYRCPNRKCKLHNRYEIDFGEKRCPECNQLLDWSDTDE